MGKKLTQEFTEMWANLEGPTMLVQHLRTSKNGEKLLLLRLKERVLAEPGKSCSHGVGIL